ncbi:hypothetical protein DFH09DRAFT_1112622 [Mycena vulgaris]|nr:hypothetical protein DFH09DRAFT_1112622 [Mycena vulgaris]
MTVPEPRATSTRCNEEKRKELAAAPSHCPSRSMDNSQDLAMARERNGHARLTSVEPTATPVTGTANSLISLAIPTTVVNREAKCNVEAKHRAVDHLRELEWSQILGRHNVSEMWQARKSVSNVRMVFGVFKTNYMAVVKNRVRTDISLNRPGFRCGSGCGSAVLMVSEPKPAQNRLVEPPLEEFLRRFRFRFSVFISFFCGA